MEYGQATRDLSGESPTLDTNIVIAGEVQVSQLRLKLAEYNQRYADLRSDMAYTHPEALLIRFGREGMRSLFKESILRQVLALNDERDIATAPVTMDELAERIGTEYQVDVSVSSAVPFIHHSDGTQDYITPDWASLRALDDSSPYNLVFAEAFSIVRGYCTGNLGGLQGGTGLPEA